MNTSITNFNQIRDLSNRRKLFSIPVAEYASFSRQARTLTVGLSPSKKICFICFNENLLKLMKNVFYFILKALFVLKIFKFKHDFLVM